MTTATNTLTSVQERALRAALEKGGAWYGRQGSAMGGAFRRVCEALAQRGLVEDSAPFPITGAGRAALAAASAARREKAYRRGECWAMEEVRQEREAEKRALSAQQQAQQQQADAGRRSFLRTALAVGFLAGTTPAAIAAPVQPDPIFAGIETVRATEAALTAALRDLDEDDAERVRIADEAADRSGDARNALSAMLPTTPAGFRALIQFHAEDVMWMEPDTYGALALRDIAKAMDALLQSRARASP